MLFRHDYSSRGVLSRSPPNFNLAHSRSLGSKQSKNAKYYEYVAQKRTPKVNSKFNSHIDNAKIWSSKEPSEREIQKRIDPDDKRNDQSLCHKVWTARQIDVNRTSQEKRNTKNDNRIN